MAVSKIILLHVFFVISLHLHGQSFNGKEKITISFNNERLQPALLRLDGATDRQLSYNPQILPSEVFLNQSFQSETLEIILEEILGNAFETKQIGNYLIIQKTTFAKKEKATFQLKGGIIDAATGEELEDVSIYEVNSLQSTLSDERGEFNLEAETDFEVATFVISKRFYQDTIIHLSQLSVKQGPIVLKEEKEEIRRRSIRERVNVLSSGLARVFTSNKIRKNARNINLVDTRTFQFSLVPSIGTNRKLSSQIKNKISFNLVAGYSYGLRGFEMGGVYNINREEVRGVQLGGFGNTAGGEVHGLQMGGFINTTKDYVRGTQIGGFINVASDSVEGFQMGGFTNLTREMRGFQMAGFNNHTKSMNGFQMSGFINTAKRMDGLQMAGFINTAQQMDGLQAAGFINIAKEVKGVQFSIINIADSVASGIQFGVINITKKNGFISPALESGDVIPFRLSLRTGLDRFYSVLSAGIRGDNEYWTYGVGMGSRLFLSKKKTLLFNPEFRWFNVAEGRIKDDEANHLYKFNFNLGYQLFKHLSLTAGPSINLYSTNRLDEMGEPIIDIAGNTILDRSSGDKRNQLWIGYMIGIGF